MTRHRVAAQLTQGQLAEKTGINRVVLSGDERDRKEPDWRNLTQLLAALGLRLLQIPEVQPLPSRRPLGVMPGKPWTAAEDKLVRKLPPKEAAERTGRPLSAIYKRRHELQVTRGRRKPTKKPEPQKGTP
jgi:transcriptional regulator with XRE-family HTH domain